MHGARASLASDGELSPAALVLSTVLAIPARRALRHPYNGVLDHASRLASLFLQSMPSFWLGLMLILLFAVSWGAAAGLRLGTPAPPDLARGDAGGGALAQNVRLIRSGMLEVLQQDYVRTARAKGLAERGVIYRHALRNAACRSSR